MSSGPTEKRTVISSFEVNDIYSAVFFDKDVPRTCKWNVLGYKGCLYQYDPVFNLGNNLLSVKGKIPIGSVVEFIPVQ